ncbi:MAG: hypothetical protein AB3N24_06215 [Leisingera sp.]
MFYGSNASAGVSNIITKTGSTGTGHGGEEDGNRRNTAQLKGDDLVTGG